eukprot:RCo039639
MRRPVWQLLILALSFTARALDMVCYLPWPQPSGYSYAGTGCSPPGKYLKASACKGVTCAPYYSGTASVRCDAPYWTFNFSGCSTIPTCSVSNWASLHGKSSSETTVQMFFYQCSGTLDFSFFHSATSIWISSATFVGPLTIQNLPSTLNSLEVSSSNFDSSLSLGS